VNPHRKKLRRYEVPFEPRYLTFSCFGRLPLLGSPAIRDAFADRIEAVRASGAFRLIAWVIMPEHVHMLIVPALPDWPVSEILRAIKRPFAAQVLRRWRQLDAPILTRLADKSGATRFWLRGGGYDRNVLPEHRIELIIDYIHWNPVYRKLVVSPLDWRWSSARWYAGIHTGLVTTEPLGDFA
jgi:putative transposase